MATFKTFEDIEAWQLARRLTLAIYGISKKSPAGEVLSHLYVALDQGYIDQGQFRRLERTIRDTGRKNLAD